MRDEGYITVREWLRAARARLEDGPTGAPHEARLLVEAVLGLPPAGAVREAERRLTAEERGELDRLLAARIDGMPLQYLTRTAPFRDLEIAVGPGVFVPRPETEGLVDHVLGVVRRRPGGRVLELCAGSGAVLAAILSECPGIVGVGVERSAAALRFAERNLAAAGVAGRARLFHGDLYDPLAAGLCFTAIVANPPYIPDALYETLPRDVRDFEPREALLGGPDGTDVIRRIVAGAPERLEAGGLLALEIDASHGARVRALIEACGVFREIRVAEDLAGRPRYALAVKEGGPVSGGGGSPGRPRRSRPTP